jgi:transposase
MGHRKAGVPGRRYTKEFKREAIRLGQSVGYSEASRRLGMSESSLFNWVKLDRAGKLGASAGVSATPRSAKELEAEVDRLRRELAAAKVDTEILKMYGLPRKCKVIRSDRCNPFCVNVSGLFVKHVGFWP